MSTPTPFPSQPDDAIAASASAWLARRDRGLSPQEQDEYLQWLREDPRHGAALAHLQKTWGALDALAEWRPAHSAQPNPDLLAQPASPAFEAVVAPRRARWRARPFARVLLAAAAAIAAGIFVFYSNRPPSHPADLAAGASAEAGVRILAAPDPTSLADGSRVTAKSDGAFEVLFTATERRVRVVRGEVHFAVAKDPARPFVVEAGHVAVRAIGTAFDVMLAMDAVEVLVTEGHVQVEQAAAGFAPTPVSAGERAVVETMPPVNEPVVQAVDAAEVERTLVWRHAQIEFRDLPLREVVAELNRRNRQQLRVGDAESGQMLVGGTFRADNVDAFVRLLERSFGIAAERRDDGTTVLRRAK